MVTVFTEIIQGAIVRTAQQGAASYKDTPKGFPDPAFVLQLPDEVYSGSNLFAVQKHFDGPFQFDVLFESSSAKQKLSCKVSQKIHPNSMLTRTSS